MLYQIGKNTKKLEGATFSKGIVTLKGDKEALAGAAYKEPADFFRLQQYKEQIVQRSGFGEKSYNNLIESIENAKKTTPRRLLYGLGIKGIGAGTAALISGKNNDDWNKIINLSKEELLQIEGVGETLANTAKIGRASCRERV